MTPALHHSQTYSVGRMQVMDSTTSVSFQGLVLTLHHSQTSLVGRTLVMAPTIIATSALFCQINHVLAGRCNYPGFVFDRFVKVYVVLENRGRKLSSKYCSRS